MPDVVLVGERHVLAPRSGPARARARSSGRSRAGGASARRTKRGSPPMASWIVCEPRRVEQSSLITQIQLPWVWARIDVELASRTGRWAGCRSPSRSRPAARPAPAGHDGAQRRRRHAGERCSRAAATASPPPRARRAARARRRQPPAWGANLDDPPEAAAVAVQPGIVGGRQGRLRSRRWRTGRDRDAARGTDRAAASVGGDGLWLPVEQEAE